MSNKDKVLRKGIKSDDFYHDKLSDNNNKRKQSSPRDMPSQKKNFNYDVDNSK
jgi:hypothetical protein